MTGAVEGAYAVATGSLRSLSEQQLMDCDAANAGCQEEGLEAEDALEGETEAQSEEESLRSQEMPAQ